MKKIITIYLILLLPSLAKGDDFSEAELFMKAFGQNVETQTTLYDLIIDEKKICEIEIEASSDSYTINKIENFKRCLNNTYKEETYNKLSSKITIEKLKEKSFNIQENHSTLSLTLFPKASQRKVMSQNLRDQNFEEVNTTSLWSLYVNNFYNYSTKNKALNYQGDFAFNHKFWTIDGNHQLKDKKIHFSRVTIQKDWRKSMSRLSMGDINFTSRGLLSSMQGGGISLKRENSLWPGFKTRKLNQRSFFLKQSAQVEIFINNRLISRSFLKAGEHIIENYALPRGRSELRVEIHYQNGEKETQQFNESFNFSLLRKKFYDFELSLFNNHLKISDDYEDQGLKDSLLLSRVHYGLTDNFTSSYQLGLNTHFNFLELNFDYASPLGNFSLSNAFSRLKNQAKGNAHELSWFYQNNGSESDFWRGLALSLGYESTGYSNSHLRVENQEDTIYLGINTQFSLQKNINFDLNYQSTYQDMNILNHDFTLALNKNWSNSFRSSLNVNYKTQNQNNFRASLNLQLLPNKRSSISTLFDDEGNYTLSSSYQSKSQIPGYIVEGSLGSTEGVKTLNLNANYTHPFMQASLNVDSNTIEKSINSNINLAQAIGIVDGKVGFARPINGSFALFKLENFNKKRELKINTDDFGGHQTKLGTLPSIIGDLTAYTSSHFEIDNNDIAPGEKIDNALSKVVPRYKSGSIIKIKKISHFYVTAKFHYLDKPLGNIFYDVIDNNGESIAQSFTDDDGNTMIEGLSPGQYMLDFGDYAPTYKMKINEVENEIFDLGYIELE